MADVIFCYSIMFMCLAAIAIITEFIIREAKDDE